MEVSTAVYISAASLLTAAQESQPLRTNTAVSQGTPTVTVTLSDTAQALLATSRTQSSSSIRVSAAASTAVDNLLSSRGSAIYTIAINSLKTSPTDLGVQAGNPNLTDSQKLALWNQVNARQYAAYGHIGYGDDVGLSYAKAQIEYAQSLSPAER